MFATQVKNRVKRHKKVRNKISGTKARPRISVFRSNSYLYVQLIDDETGKTVVSANDLKQTGKGGKSESLKKLAKTVGDLAAKAGISQVVFDRGGYKYHGRVKALAEELRKVGLKF